MSRTKVVILGSGWSGFTVARMLAKQPHFDVSMISPRNHFLFTPLLCSTTVGTLEFRTIMEPVRLIENLNFAQASAQSISLEDNKVQCIGTYDNRSFEMRYDKLVIGVGADVGTFGIPGADKYAFPLKEAADARNIRKKIVEHFERASEPYISNAERRRILSFVVIGGGPTGTEFAAELYDFLQSDISVLYPRLHSEVTLVDAGSKVLSGFDDSLSTYALKQMKGHGVHVMLNRAVKEITPEQIFLSDGSVLNYGMAIWSGGISPRPFTQHLPLKHAETGRLLLSEQLHPYTSAGDTLLKDIYVTGDCGQVEGNPHPATAQIAAQQGRFVANHMMGKDKGKFVYKHAGTLAYVGGFKGVSNLPNAKVSGLTAWVIWRSAYLTMLVSVRNKILVPMHWFKTFVFGRDTSWF